MHDTTQEHVKPGLHGWPSLEVYMTQCQVVTVTDHPEELIAAWVVTLREVVMLEYPDRLSAGRTSF